ncbi:MAG: DNA replication and repair protein RecF [Ignavibacteria bacterium]
MVLKKIVLKNFRNYGNKEIIFNNKFNFIYGNNGHGKTNILEGISFSTFGKSFLGSPESDCIKFGENEFVIESEFQNDLDNIDKLIINYNLDSRSKSIHLNREKVSAFSSQIFGKFPFVFLSPKSLNITYGNPSDRRRFFDILISQTSRLYLDYLKDLAKILRQKNALLKNYSVYKKYSYIEMTDLLNSYNEKFTEVSAHILFKRFEFLKEFMIFCEKNFLFLFSGGQSGSIRYFSDTFGEIDADKSNLTLDNIKEEFAGYIAGKSGEEILKAVTLAGPHRDDYLFKMSKNNSQENFELKNFASQGEHKTFLVALKLSEYDYLKDRKSTNPILLLDDVLSELDENRVAMIISHLRDYGQIFLTTTDMSYTENLKKFYSDDEISVFKIENGTVN